MMLEDGAVDEMEASLTNSQPAGPFSICLHSPSVISLFLSTPFWGFGSRAWADGSPQLAVRYAKKHKLGKKNQQAITDNYT